MRRFRLQLPKTAHDGVKPGPQSRQDSPQEGHQPRLHPHSRGAWEAGVCGWTPTPRPLTRVILGTSLGTSWVVSLCCHCRWTPASLPPAWGLTRAVVPKQGLLPQLLPVSVTTACSLTSVLRVSHPNTAGWGLAEGVPSLWAPGYTCLPAAPHPQAGWESGGGKN